LRRHGLYFDDLVSNMKNTRNFLPAILRNFRTGMTYGLFVICAAGLAANLCGCAADPLFINTVTSTPTNSLTTQTTIAAALIGAKVNFVYSDFYSLTVPSAATGCAGDANAFYDPLAMVLPSYSTGYVGFTGVTGPTGPYRLPASLIDATTTIRPSFISNISVDLTDSNANLPDNKARSCSYGESANAPVSSCATFDYGAVDGVPTNMGGSLILFGGMQTVNAASTQNSALQSTTVSCGPQSTSAVNTCNPSLYALAVNALPASAAGTAQSPGITTASGPISNWENISGVTGYSGPVGTAGASMAYDSALKQLLVFGGSAPLTAFTPQDTAANTYVSWTFNLKTQIWSPAITSFVVNPEIEIAYDGTSQTPKPDGGRALFGYAAIHGTGLNQFSSTGLVSEAGVDTTDRIFVIGGLGNNCVYGVCADVHKINPTYGPEYFDGEAPAASAAYPPANPANPSPIQWIDSYPMQIVTNSTTPLGVSQFPQPSPTPSPSFGVPPANFAAVGLNNNNPASQGQGASSTAIPAVTTVNEPGAGYPLIAGGFYGFSGAIGSTNTPGTPASCSDINHCGSLQIGLKVGDARSSERQSPNFMSVTNVLDVNKKSYTPETWIPIQDGAETTPFFGGATMLKGINLTIAAVPAMTGGGPPAGVPGTDAENQVVYFGGADCRDYLTDPNAICTNWDPSAAIPLGNPGKYWVFGADPGNSFAATGVTAPYPASQRPPSIVMAGSPPLNAGMAAARGVDSNNNPLIVAVGGMTHANKVDSSNIIYYLYNNGNVPTWATATVSGPGGFGNASLVFSHVTGKFYLYGGYTSATSPSSSEMWALTITTPGCATSGGCTFSWSNISTTNGLTCFPNCPPARRSHRMVEVNYNYFNSPREPTCTSPSQPCSFGLFMQGGTATGFAPYLNDTWMFDPTANNGKGHWQLMGELPPRTLSAMASLDYTPTATQSTVHRAVLFGGETGLQDPLTVTSANGYFVPPTLGDTWMYDYDNSSWNRVKLYGERFENAVTAATTAPLLSETEARAASNISDTTTQMMSPPPTSGGIMVTRTLSRKNHLTTDTPTQLAIPEVYFFGGRKKDGYYNLLSSVFKFCAGSTGEKPATTSFKGTAMPVTSVDDASCDAYDAGNNPNSLSPVSSFVGRWLPKVPTGTGAAVPAQRASFMGAGTYDAAHDLIILFGGLFPGAAPYSTTSVLNTSNSATDSTIWEYTPPSSSVSGTPTFNGTWATVASCAESPETPTGRYGHSIGYDTAKNILIVAGGYDVNGNLLVQTETFSDNRTTTIPEIWSAYRVDDTLAGGLASQNIPPVTTGPFPCYYWSRVTTFGNVDSVASRLPPTSGVAHAASAFVEASGYNTGYYTTNDPSCYNAGPIASSDTNISKLLVGGVYIDLDRKQLGVYENLLLNLTILPLGTTNVNSDLTQLSSDQSAIFKVHLIHTGQSGDDVRQVKQPRTLTYTASDLYPQLVPDVAVVAPPVGEIRQEQVYLPISIDPTIDRIRIERYSGNAILIDASVYRLGPH
jgi:hypothetical protein